MLIDLKSGPIVGIIQNIVYPVVLWIALPTVVAGILAEKWFGEGKGGAGIGAGIGVLLCFLIGPWSHQWG